MNGVMIALRRTGARLEFSEKNCPWPAGDTALSKQSFASRDCGLVWNFTGKDKLNRFLQKHCDGLDDAPSRQAARGCD